MTPRATTVARFSPILAAAAALLLVRVSPALAGAITCRPNYDFSVEVGGDFPKEAKFYQSDAQGKFFIDVPACKTGLLMDLQARKILAVPREQVRPVDLDLMDDRLHIFGHRCVADGKDIGLCNAPARLAAVAVWRQLRTQAQTSPGDATGTDHLAGNFFDQRFVL